MDPDPATAALPRGMKSQMGNMELEDELGFQVKPMLRSPTAKPRELQSTGVVLNAHMALIGHFLQQVGL